MVYSIRGETHGVPGLALCKEHEQECSGVLDRTSRMFFISFRLSRRSGSLACVLPRQGRCCVAFGSAAGWVCAPAGSNRLLRAQCGRVRRKVAPPASKLAPSLRLLRSPLLSESLAWRWHSTYPGGFPPPSPPLNSPSSRRSSHAGVPGSGTWQWRAGLGGLFDVLRWMCDVRFLIRGRAMPSAGLIPSSALGLGAVHPFFSCQELSVLFFVLVTYQRSTQHRQEAS